jgi:hypothetical protein
VYLQALTAEHGTGLRSPVGLQQQQQGVVLQQRLDEEEEAYVYEQEEVASVTNEEHEWLVMHAHNMVSVRNTHLGPHWLQDSVSVRCCRALMPCLLRHARRTCDAHIRVDSCLNSNT